jgi:transcriptional regulator with XRE-family HTH domain
LLNLTLAKQRREEMGLSLAELGGLLGVDGSTVHRWETGEYEPRTIAKAQEWARVLSIPFADLAAPRKEAPKEQAS